MIFNVQPSEHLPSRKKRWLGYALVFILTSAATTAMMLCPCDVVGLHDIRAIAFVAVAALFAIAAVHVLYRRLSSYSGITGFLRAVMALAIVGVSVYAELYFTMGIVARMASRR